MDSFLILNQSLAEPFHGSITCNDKNKDSHQRPVVVVVVVGVDLVVDDVVVVVVVPVFIHSK